MPDALAATTLPIYPGLVQAQEYAGLHTPKAWFPRGLVTKLGCLRSYVISVRVPETLLS